MVAQTGAVSSPLGNFALQLAVVVFFGTGGHLTFFRAVAASYEAVPLLGFPSPGLSRSVLELAVGATAKMVLAAVGMAAPVLAALFLADLALGFINRVSPQIPVHFLGLPAKALGGIALLLLAVSAVAVAIRGELGDAMGAIRRLVESGVARVR